MAAMVPPIETVDGAIARFTAKRAAEVQAAAKAHQEQVCRPQHTAA